MIVGRSHNGIATHPPPGAAVAAARPVAIAPETTPPRTAPGRPRPRWALAGALVLALVVTGLARHWFEPGGTRPLTALGTLEATEVTVSAEVSARIREIPVDEGQSVSAGEVLVRLDDALPRLQFRQAAPAEQQLLDLQLEKYVLEAPLAGVVLRRAAEPGEIALPGAPLLVIADLGRLDLTVYLPQRDLGRVYVGQAVVVEPEALPGMRAVGTVRAIADQAEFTPRNTQTVRDRMNLAFAVKVRVPNADRALKGGMSATAHFVE